MSVTRCRQAVQETVSPGLLRAWFLVAQPGARLPYAIGRDLPQRAAGVVLVRSWIDRGLVSPVRARDEGVPGQWVFMIEKADCGVIAPAVLGGRPTAAAMRPAQRVAGEAQVQRRKLQAILAQRALAADYCPSNAQLAKLLGLSDDQPGRDRVQYLLRGLVAHGKISIENRGTNSPRIVTILAAGQAFQRETRA